MRISILFLVCLLVPVAAPAKIILVIGDSLSAAYGMPVEEGWVALLQQRLDREGSGCRIVNASISGDTTANARARLAAALETHQPAVVLLEIGGNDGLRGLPLAQMKANLAEMIDRARAADAAVLLIGVQLPPNYGPQYTQRFQSVYRELARETGVTLLPSLLDGIGTEEALMQPDGIHPERAAQPLIRDRVREVLEPLLEQNGCNATAYSPIPQHSVVEMAARSRYPHDQATPGS